MAFKISIPFQAFQLHLHSGERFLLPLTDKEVFRVGQPLHILAGKYAELLQRKVMNKGSFQQLLDEYREGQYEKDSLRISFPAAKDRISYPAFELEFDYFFNEQHNGFWGLIPALGLEVFAPKEEVMKKRLQESIKLEFARKKRLAAVQQIISAIWFDVVEFKQYEVEINAPTPKEIDQMYEERPDKLLPQVARHLKVSRQVTYGRKEELEQFSRALKNKFSRNVLLVGPSGVGKTALVWELARQQKKRRIKGIIWETTASTLIKELTRDTGWQDNLAFLCKELSETGDILFVRNLVELFEVGRYEGNDVSMADYLRTFMSRGEVTVISECIEEELARIELRSPNFISFFQIIRLEEPKDELENIILQKVGDIAANRHIQISKDAIREIIRLNRRFTPYSGMPGKPIRFLESILINKKNAPGRGSNGGLNIARSEVIRHFCEESGMPLFMVDPSIPMNVVRIKNEFNSQLFGQGSAVESVVDLLASVKTALTRSGKPIASFLFVGPTGVGKTEMAKILAGFMFSSRQRMVRFDMSEFSNPYSVIRLIGTNYDSEGLLTSAIRREPFTVLLFDEIEKAHADFFDLLLQILSEGRLTDSQGKLVNFCSTIIIMTSNIGSGQMQSTRISLSKQVNREDIRSHFMSSVQQHFRPEFFNRIDQVISFNPLDAKAVRLVVEREIKLFRQREGIRFRRMDLQITKEVLEYLAKEGYDSKYGARQLQRIIRNELIIPLAQQLNHQDFDDQLIISVLMDGSALKVHIEADPLGLELLIEELDKINYSDLSSQLRRKIHKLMEGNLCVRLESELYALERRKKKQKKKFWENLKEAEKYSFFLETKNNVKQLKDIIEQYEMDFNLASLNLNIYNPGLIDKIEEWEDGFFKLQIELYSRLNPKSNQCHFAIYGTELRQISELYRKFFRAKGYEYSAQTIWFREKYYNEEIFQSTSSAEGVSGDIKPAPVKRKREEYILKSLKIDSTKSFVAPQKGDILCGIVFALKGPCAFLYFKVEQGVHRWKTSNQKNDFFVIAVENHDFITQKNIHRKEFFTHQPPRRTIEPHAIRDKIFKLNREYNRLELGSLMIEQLDKLFKYNLEFEVMR